MQKLSIRDVYKKVRNVFLINIFEKQLNFGDLSLNIEHTEIAVVHQTEWLKPVQVSNIYKTNPEECKKKGLEKLNLTIGKALQCLSSLVSMITMLIKVK